MTTSLKYWNSTGTFNLHDYTSPIPPVPQTLALDNSTSAIVCRHSTNYGLKQIGPDDRIPAGYEELFELYQVRRRVVIKRGKAVEDLCVVVGTREGEQGKEGDGAGGVQLKQGEIFRMGKATLQVCKIKFDEARLTRKEQHNQKIFTQKIFSQISQKKRIGQQYYEDSHNASTIEQAPCCRYCLQKSIADQNLLTILCKCQGSTKYVHEECVKAWILQRSKYAELKDGVFRAERAGLKCEICKEEFDIQEILPCFGRQGTQYAILLVENSDNQQTYWILELSKIKDQKFVVGRKYQCDISIADLSVSREHCCLHWDSKKAVLSVWDLGSKFGTLLKKKVVQITKPTELQIGRTRILVNGQKQQISWFQKIKNIVKKKEKQNHGKIALSDATRLPKSND